MAAGAPGRSSTADADPEAVARSLCLRWLAERAHTRGELGAKLAKKGVPGESADAVLDRFVEVGLVDDAAFAAAWVQSRHTGRGLARSALRQELRRRGVDEHTIESAVEEVSADDEAGRARALVARKIGTTRGLDPAARTRRLAGLLARKGYPPGVAYQVVREAIAAEGLDPALASCDTADTADAADD